MTKLLRTDAYKISMAEAGFALREETFGYSHRKGGVNGWHYMPVDVKKFVKDLLPDVINDPTDYDYLSQHNYEVGAGFRKAFSLKDNLRISSVPKGSWFYNREPAFFAKGPSAVSSWLEPTALQLNFRIQLATLYKAGKTAELAERIRFATCQREKDIILETLDSLAIDLGSKIKLLPQFNIEVREQAYYEWVYRRAKELVGIVENPDRLFEVGMRGVSCSEQHEIVLKAIKDAGVLRTSNVELAQKLNMIPVGTMGHEHPQRFNLDDYAAYTAMKDRFPGFLFYLPDTTSTLMSGVPSALRVIAEDPGRDAGIRFDSEANVRSHYTYTVALAREKGLEPRLALESGWNKELTVEFEELRKQVRWPMDRQAYGYGGYFTKPEWPTFSRDDVAAVWKLSQSGSLSTMKFGDEPKSAKESIPGMPVIWRIRPGVDAHRMPASIIAQEGEQISLDSYYLLTDKESDDVLPPNQGSIRREPPVFSAETQRLINQCRARKQEVLAQACLKG